MSNTPKVSRKTTAANRLKLFLTTPENTSASAPRLRFWSASTQDQETPTHSHSEFIADYSIVNLSVFSEFRSAAIDVDEARLWTRRMRDLLISGKHEDYGIGNEPSENPKVDDPVFRSLLTPIRRGVPDALKRSVLMRSHGVSDFISKHSDFQSKLYQQVFGSVMPCTFEGFLPTFSGGFLGTEEELHGSPIEISHLEIEIPEGCARNMHTNVANCNPYGSPNSIVAVSWNDMGTLMTPPKVPQLRIDQMNSRDDVGTSMISEDDGSSSSSLSDMKSRCGRFFRISPREKTRFRSNSKSEKIRTPESLSTRIPSRQRFNSDLQLDECRQPQSPPICHTPTRDSSSASETASPGILVLTPPSTGALKEQRHLMSVYKMEKVSEYARLLTPTGADSIRRILWCLNGVTPQLEFAPMLVPLACFVRCHLNEQETLVLLNNLIKTSYQRLIAGRQEHTSPLFLCLTRSSFIRLIKMAMAVCTRHLPQVTKKLSTLNFDLAAWLARCMQDCFTRLLPFDMATRIMINFIVEGSVVLLRYALAVLILSEPRILAAQSSEECNIILLCREFRKLGPEGLNALTKTAFRVSITDRKSRFELFNGKTLPTPYLTRVKLLRFYRPRLELESRILTHQHWETLWRWLAAHLRILDPHLVYSSETDGVSLVSFQRKLWGNEDNPMIFVIQTTSNEIIGGFAPMCFCHESQRRNREQREISLDTAFIFSLEPEPVSYYWSGNCSKLMEFNSHFLTFGSDMAAIYLDEDLNHGVCHKSDAFNSPSLISDEDFRMKIFEVWNLW